MSKAKKYYLFHKPYGVLCAFTNEHGKKDLSSYLDVPQDVYPVGRLDENSEGLLLLTNDKAVNHQLLNPQFKHKRSYIVQLEGQINKKALGQIEKGVEISLGTEKYTTLPCKILKTSINKLPECDRRIDFDKSKGTSAVKLTLHEGKNRQVRKMCAAAGFPVIRLIRTEIEQLHLADLHAGEYKKVPRPLFYRSLNLRSQ